MSTISGNNGDNVLVGTSSSDSISGAGGSDLILAGSGNDTVSGGSGNDLISGGSGNDYIDGGSGNDLISGGSGNDYIDGGSGNDLISGGSGNDTLLGGSGNDVLSGGSGNDFLAGDSGNDFLEGGSGNDTLVGGSGQDMLVGSSGNDILIGVEGADWLQGGSGNDLFVYQNASDSNACAWDRIVDFQQGKDKIDLYALLGDKHLTWGNKIATAHGVWQVKSGSSTIVNIDLDGDKMADMKIELTNTSGLVLTESDFIGVGGSAPVAGNDAYSVDEDGVLTVNAAIGVLDNDTDADGDALSAALVAGPAHGTLSLNADGSFTYTPDADFNGVDSFTYRTNDGSADSNVATVALTVNAVNDAPMANDDDAAADEDNSVTTASVLGNDGDVDSALTPASITGFTQGAHGSVVHNGDGTFTYTPDANFNGTDSFTYTVSDGELTDTATVSVTINAVNDAPVAHAADNATDEDHIVNGNNLTADDVDGDHLSFRLVSVDGAPADRFDVHPGGTYSFDPRGLFDFLGEGAGADVSFQYVANDGTVDSAPATVTIHVTGVNDAPVAMHDEDFADTTIQGGAAGNVLANDTDPDLGDTLMVTSVGGTDFGGDAEVFVKGNYGDLFMLSDGTWTYTLRPADAPASDDIELFDYMVADQHGAVDSAQLSINVQGTGVTSVSSPSSVVEANGADTPGTGDQPVNAGGGAGGSGGNTAPVAMPDLVFASASGNTGNVLANDSDPDLGDSLIVTEVNGNYVDGDLFVSGQYGFLFVNGGGDWSYNLNQAGTDALAQGADVVDVFDYMIADASGATASSTLTFDFLL